MAAYKCVKELVQSRRPRLVLLAGTAGVFPGSDATLGDVVWVDAAKCCGIETDKVDADGSFRWGHSRPYIIRKQFPLDFGDFRDEWAKNFLSLRSGQLHQALAAATGDAEVPPDRSSTLFERLVDKSLRAHRQRAGTPQLVRAGWVLSMNTRLSSPIVAERAALLFDPTIGEMELAGCIDACNEADTTLVSIRCCSDLIGTAKRDADSASASFTVAHACAAFLDTSRVQSAIRELTLGSVKLKHNIPVVSAFGDSIAPFTTVDAAPHEFLLGQLEQHADRVCAELQGGNAKAAELAEVLSDLMQGICGGCGHGLERFKAVRNLIFEVAKRLDPRDNPTFICKALELFVITGDPRANVIRKIVWPWVEQSRGELNVYHSKRLAHAAPSALAAADLMMDATRQVAKSDHMDPLQAALAYACQLCQRLPVADRKEFESSIEQFDVALSRTGIQSGFAHALRGKVIVLALIREWLRQEHNWMKVAESLAREDPSTAWLTPGERVLYLTFIGGFGPLKPDQQRVLDFERKRLVSSGLRATCNLRVAGVMEVADSAEPLQLRPTQMLTIVRKDRRFGGASAHTASLPAAGG